MAKSVALRALAASVRQFPLEQGADAGGHDVRPFSRDNGEAGLLPHRPPFLPPAGRDNKCGGPYRILPFLVDHREISFAGTLTQGLLGRRHVSTLGMSMHRVIHAVLSSLLRTKHFAAAYLGLIPSVIPAAR